jgi:hypothetical protein
VAEVPEPEPAPEPAPAPEVAEPAPEPEPEPAPEVAEEEPEAEPEPVEVAARQPEIAPSPARPTPPPQPTLKPRSIPAVARNEPAAEPPEDDFDAFLRSIEAQSEQLRADQRREGQGRSLEGNGTTNGRSATGTARLFPAEEQALIRQITSCWRLPPGVVGVNDMVVRLRIQVRRDGQVERVSVEDQSRLDRDPLFRAVAESARRAVNTCSPLKLAPEKYEAWREMVLNFRPEDAISS